jgi:hypothetical protein
MFKKVAFFGFTLGSAATAMHLIYFFNHLYLKANLLAVLPMIGNIVFSGLATYMFIKALQRDSAITPNLGKTLFGSLSTALLVAMCTIAGLQYVVKNKPELITEFQNHSINRTKEYVLNNFPKEEQQAKLLESEQMVVKQLDMMSLSVAQIQMCLSTGLVVTLLVFVRNMKSK